jgi:protein involved in polysaccharide export with SLBB domain
MKPNMLKKLMHSRKYRSVLLYLLFHGLFGICWMQLSAQATYDPAKVATTSEIVTRSILDIAGATPPGLDKVRVSEMEDRARARDLDSLRRQFEQSQLMEMQEGDDLESLLQRVRALQLELESMMPVAGAEDQLVEVAESVIDSALIDSILAAEQVAESEYDEVFGIEYFRNRPVKLFNSAQDVKPPDNYVIGPGDELSINIWGNSDYSELFVVEREGYIQPRFVGRIYVKGLTVKDARELLKSKFGQVYNLGSSNFDLTINYSRVILANVVGEVKKPGSYTVPAINNAFNILTYVGGPSDIGSIRNIQVKRDGEIVDRFDLYRYLFTPEKQPDIFLQNNDYLFVPVARKIVTITGEVVRPGKYELLERETLDDLLVYAAGYTPVSYTGSVQIRRYGDNRVYIFDVDLDSLKAVNGVLPLMNGDEVRIRRLPERVVNYLEIRGPLLLPGRYQFRENLRVSDLIEEAGGFAEPVYTGEAYISRLQNDLARTTLKIDLAAILENPGGEEDLGLQKGDEVELFAVRYFFDPFGVSIVGAVRNPRTFNLQKDMTVRDLILLAGGLEPSAYLARGYITRKNRQDNSVSYLAFAIDTSNNMAALDAYRIREDDQVTILSNLDFKIDERIAIEGAVKNPGIFELWRELSLKDLILLSGGLMENAYLPRAYIFREYDNLEEEIIPVFLDTANNMLALDQVILRRNDRIRIFSSTDYHDSFPVEVNGFVRNPGLFIHRDNMSLADALILAGGLKYSASNHRIEIARIANFEESVTEDVPLKIEILSLDISIDLSNDATANEFKLQPFDKVFVRETPGFDFQEQVYIGGEVRYPGLYVLTSKDEKVTSLIERAGGLTEYAFIGGARMDREKDNLGNVIMNLERAMRRPNSKFNYILREGDAVYVPREKDLVTVTGKIAYPYIDADSTVNVAYTSGKRAKYYVKNYATGFTKQSKKRDTYVVYANGQVKQAKHFFGIKFYPKVERGATVHVPEKIKRRSARPPKTERSFDPMRFTEAILSAATSAITLYLLIDNTND